MTFQRFALPWRRRGTCAAMGILGSGTDVDRQYCGRGRRRCRWPSARCVHGAGRRDHRRACCKMATRACAPAQRTTGPGGPAASCSCRWPPGASAGGAVSWCAVRSGPGQGGACAWSCRHRGAGTAMGILESVRMSTRSMLWPWPATLTRPGARCARGAGRRNRRRAAGWPPGRVHRRRALPGRTRTRCSCRWGPPAGVPCAPVLAAMWILESGTDVDRQCCGRDRRR